MLWKKPRNQRIARQRFSDPMVMISERPATVNDRAVPGHWEGDLILGKGNKSSIGTLVERSTRYVMLLQLPNGHGVVEVRDALVETIQQLPAHLCGSLTWDQGSDMAGHKSFTIAIECLVYFCDPGSPWQRGSNENTNGLLRQYFPQGTDLFVHTKEDLEFVAMQLNDRPRATLGFVKPVEEMAVLLDYATEI
ncbi:transposase for insertion sequence [Corynebacterium diphtheriae]|nr:transposase for insertion sequence [Corynebacterium diphtheriae]